VLRAELDWCSVTSVSCSLGGRDEDGALLLQYFALTLSGHFLQTDVICHPLSVVGNCCLAEITRHFLDLS